MQGRRFSFVDIHDIPLGAATLELDGLAVIARDNSPARRRRLCVMKGAMFLAPSTLTLPPSAAYAFVCVVHAPW